MLPAAQGTSYHGIAIGIGKDSLDRLSRQLTDREPFCLHEAGYDRCTSVSSDDGTIISAYLQNGVLKDVQIRRTLTTATSTDSLRRLFAVWGDPDSLALPPRNWLPSETTFVSVSLGRWTRRGVDAWVGIHSEPHNPHTEFPFGFLDVQLTEPGFRATIDASTTTNLAP